MALRPIIRRLVRFIRIVFFFSSVCCLTLSVAFAVYTFIFIGTATRARGEVVKIEAHPDSEDNSGIYAPVLRFIASDGKAYTITSNISTSPPEFSVGQSVQVLYRQSDPEGARIATFGHLWLLPIVLAFIGIIHGLIGGACRRLERRFDRRNPQASAQAI
jgi:hypothetical protein